jgi:lipopolysaccharide biosynthesis protein
MFKFFFIYPAIALIAIWLASDTDIGASVYALEDNYIKLEFPKASWRPADNPDLWYSFYWNADSARETLKKINDAVLK